MSEQTVNVRATVDAYLITRKIFSAFKIFMITIAACALSACLPSGEQDVNTELFKNKDEMTVKAAELKPGISKKKAFEALGISADKFSVMSLAEVQTSIYGNSMVQGSPAELENFRKRLMSCEGYALPYREIKSSSSLGFGKMKVTRTGHDLKLVLIFEKDRLLRAAVEGTHQVSQQDDQYMWDMLIKRGIGAAF